MFVYGTRLYGKVSHVPGLFYIATTFFYINWLPLFPTGSYLIIDDGTAENGVPISMNLRSVLMGWFRAVAFLGGVILLAIGLIGPDRMDGGVRIGTLSAGVALVSLGILSYFLIKIGRDQAVHLAEQAGLDPQFVHDHFDRLQGRPVTRREVGPYDAGHFDAALQKWNPNRE